jgi:hypothetical protein
MFPVAGAVWRTRRALSSGFGRRAVLEQARVGSRDRVRGVSATRSRTCDLPCSAIQFSGSEVPPARGPIARLRGACVGWRPPKGRPRRGGRRCTPGRGVRQEKSSKARRFFSTGFARGPTSPFPGAEALSPRCEREPEPVSRLGERHPRGDRSQPPAPMVRAVGQRWLAVHRVPFPVAGTRRWAWTGPPSSRGAGCCSKSRSPRSAGRNQRGGREYRSPRGMQAVRAIDRAGDSARGVKRLTGAREAVAGWCSRWPWTCDPPRGAEVRGRGRAEQRGRC